MTPQERAHAARAKRDEDAIAAAKHAPWPTRRFVCIEGTVDDADFVARRAAAAFVGLFRPLRRTRLVVTVREVES